MVDKPRIQIYVNKIQNRVTFKIKTVYHLELSTKDKDGENVPQLEITEVILIHCNIVNNQYQHDSRDISIFVPSEPFCQLLNISPSNQIYTEAYYSDFLSTEIWFTVQNSMS